MRWRLVAAGLAAVALLVGVVLAAGGGSSSRPAPSRTRGAPLTAPAPPGPSARAVPTRLLLGQRLVVGLAGTVADANLLTAVRRGEVGAVLLTEPNAPDLRTTRRLTDRLQ